MIGNDHSPVLLDCRTGFFICGAQMDAITVQIAKLELKAGDTLAVMVPFVLTSDQREAFNAMLKNLLPKGVNSAVFESGITPVVIKASETANP
jgi:hypothetical protein